MKPGPLFLLVICFFSCKHSDVFGDIQPNTSRVLAEFTEARNGATVVQEATANTVEFDLTELRIDPRSELVGQAKVKVIVNPIVVTEYNAANGTSYTPVPSSSFSSSSGSVSTSASVASSSSTSSTSSSSSSRPRVSPDGRQLAVVHRDERHF